MKKFYSVIALVAMVCTSMCLFTSCGDDEDTLRHEKLVVSALMPDYVATNGNLSNATVEAVSKAMIAAQKALAEIDYTSPEGIEKLMADAIKAEVEKLDNDVRYELKKEKVKIKLWCSNPDPDIVYIFDCSTLEASVPKTTVTINSVKLHNYAVNAFSEESLTKLNEVVDFLNNALAGKTVETDLENAYDVVGNLAIDCVRENFKDLSSLPEASDPYLRLYECIEISYSSKVNSNKVAIVRLNYLI